MSLCKSLCISRFGNSLGFEFLDVVLSKVAPLWLWFVMVYVEFSVFIAFATRLYGYSCLPLEHSKPSTYGALNLLHASPIS